MLDGAAKQVNRTGVAALLESSQMGLRVEADTSQLEKMSNNSLGDRCR
jgi:hypothetical protein